MIVKLKQSDMKDMQKTLMTRIMNTANHMSSITGSIAGMHGRSACNNLRADATRPQFSPF